MGVSEELGPVPAPGAQTPDAGVASARFGVLPPVFRAADRTPEYYDHLRAHYRETRRVPMRVAARVRFVTEDGRLFDQGQGVIRNVSPSGALITDLHLPKDSFPSVPFRVDIQMEGEPYEGIGMQARPVRFDQAQRGIGVQFREVFVAA
jgi:hypothetical protein